MNELAVPISLQKYQRKFSQHACSIRGVTVDLWWHYKKMVAHGVVVCCTRCTEQNFGLTLSEVKQV